MDQPRPSKALNIALWAAQLLVAAVLLYGATMKLTQPVSKLSAMWPWTGQIPASYVKLTGIIDMLGALGLILPVLLRIMPVLTPVAAIGILILMVCATVFHINRGEASVIGFNIFLAVLAAFIAWGRLRKAPVAEND